MDSVLIIRKYQSGCSLRSLGKFFRVSHKTIAKVLRDNSITIRKKKKEFNEDFFETIDTEEKSYWLGFIAADGCIGSRIIRNHTSLKINISSAEKDYNHLVKFCRSINSNFKPLIMIRNNAYRVNFVSKKMFNDLLDKNITPRKSLTLKPPKNVPKYLIRHWIRGYFDGDGCASFTGEGHIRFSFAGTQEVLEFIRDFLMLSINVKPHKNIFRMASSNILIIKSFYKQVLMNNSICLERKFNLIHKNMRLI